LAELRDSSLLFSLESLMAEEQERVDRERAEKEEQDRARAAERESRVRIRLETEALAAAREQQRLLEEEQRRRDEQARFEGIRAAELERVRSEVARRAELERTMAERSHELALEGIRQAVRVRTARWALVATCVAFLLASAALLWLELAVNPSRLATLEAEYVAKTRSERVRAERAERLLESSEAARRDLEERLRVRERTPVTPSKAVPETTPPRAKRPVPRPVAPQAPCLDDNDPLNPCLGKSRLR
jgi:colicin import membrane protein